MAAIRRAIADRGVYVEHVLVPPGGAWFADWSYSVGLARRRRHPEVMAFAWHWEDRAALIERIARAVAHGRRFEPGEVAADLWEGERFAFTQVRVGELGSLLPLAGRFYGRVVPALQVLVPDDRGNLPGEPGYDPGFARWQPLVGQPPVVTGQASTG